jgi:2-isopropylmalate synthase
MLALRRVSVFDTTLRDGEQAPGNAMSVDDKVKLALCLEELGVDVLEIGFPAASPQDAAAALAIARAVSRPKVAALCRATRTDIDAALAAMEPAGGGIIHLMGVASDIHLEHKRHMSRKEAIEELAASVAYAADAGAASVIIGLEDATRADRQHIQALITAGREAGGTVVGIGDTVGCATPTEFADLVRFIKEVGGLPVSVHCHDDLGLATANTLAAVDAGAEEVQVTLCGIGERAGNAALEEVAAAIATKADYFRAATGIKLPMLQDACGLLLSVIGERMPRGKAIIGENAFSTEAGIHQHGVLNDPRTYEFLKPEGFGRQRRLVIGRHSGRAVLRDRIRASGLEPVPELVEELYLQVVDSPAPNMFDDDSYLVNRYRQLGAQRVL